MHIFADQYVHTNVIEALRKIGLKVERAIDKGLERADDEEIFKYAFKNRHILLTFDTDFGNIIRFDIKKSMGVVIVYIERLTRKEIIRLTVKFFRSINRKRLQGSLFIIEPHRTRVWHHR